MPRWCRIHFLLFAAQLDGVKITTALKTHDAVDPSNVNGRLSLFLSLLCV